MAAQRFRRISLALVLFMACIGSGTVVRGQAPPLVTLIHATDLHLLVDNLDNATITKQREPNAQAAADLSTWIAKRRADDNTLRAVVLTGDLDADPCWLRPRPAAEQDKQKPLAFDECIK